MLSTLLPTKKVFLLISICTVKAILVRKCASVYRSITYADIANSEENQVYIMKKGKLNEHTSDFMLTDYTTITSVLWSWLHTLVIGVRNSILNWVFKTQSLKRKRKKVFKAAQSFFKLVITFLEYTLYF